VTEVDWEKGWIYVQRTWSDKGRRVEPCKDGEMRKVMVPAAIFDALRTREHGPRSQRQKLESRAACAHVPHASRCDHPAWALLRDAGIELNHSDLRVAGLN